MKSSILYYKNFSFIFKVGNLALFIDTYIRSITGGVSFKAVRLGGP